MEREQRDFGAQLERIEQIRRKNFDAMELWSQYLVRTPRLITAELMREMTGSGVEEETSFCALLCAVCGLDPEKKPYHRMLLREYLLPGVKKLEPSVYRADAYCRTVRFPEGSAGRWTMKQEAYEPYEAFVRAELMLEDSFREIPCIGFFSERFSFPAILEEGNEWMTVTPHEIETIAPLAAAARGCVVTFGLGLGYFAFHGSLRKEVESLTVVERDETLIRLFEEELLPQFPGRDKIRIVKEDAFDYVRNMEKERFDFAFVDLWHDTSDGLPLYLRMKKLERFAPQTEFSYWIERSILSRLRWILFEQLRQAPGGRMGEAGQFLQEELLRTLAAEAGEDLFA